MANFTTDCVFFDSVSMRAVLWATLCPLPKIRGQTAWLGAWPPVSARSRAVEQFALDQSASDGHCYER
jgi:hypothetical protein